MEQRLTYKLSQMVEDLNYRVLYESSDYKTQEIDQ